MTAKLKSKADRDNHADQCNPADTKYYRSRGASEAEAETRAREFRQEARRRANSKRDEEALD